MAAKFCVEWLFRNVRFSSLDRTQNLLLGSILYSFGVHLYISAFLNVRFFLREMETQLPFGKFY